MNHELTHTKHYMFCKTNQYIILYIMGIYVLIILFGQTGVEHSMSNEPCRFI